MEISAETFDEIVELYDRAQDEHKSTKTERDYWQGRKDGIRLVLSLIQPDESIWKDLNKSSWGFQNEEWLIVKNFMEDARYNIAAILYEIQEEKKVHPQTRINLIQWIDQYDRLSKKEITNPVTNAVDCDGGFRWKR